MRHLVNIKLKLIRPSNCRSSKFSYKIITSKTKVETNDKLENFIKLILKIIRGQKVLMMIKENNINYLTILI